MNDAGREVLVRAALDGVEQAFGTGRRGNAMCGLVVLLDAAHYDYRLSVFDIQCDPQTCAECGTVFRNEICLISHLNDDHRYDFLKIARTL